MTCQNKQFISCFFHTFSLKLQCNKYQHDDFHYGLEIINGVQEVDMAVCGLKLYHG